MVSGVGTKSMFTGGGTPSCGSTSMDARPICGCRTVITVGKRLMSSSVNKKRTNAVSFQLLGDSDVRSTLFAPNNCIQLYCVRSPQGHIINRVRLTKFVGCTLLHPRPMIAPMHPTSLRSHDATCSNVWNIRGCFTAHTDGTQPSLVRAILKVSAPMSLVSTNRTNAASASPPC